MSKLCRSRHRQHGLLSVWVMAVLITVSATLMTGAAVGNGRATLGADDLRAIIEVTPKGGEAELAAGVYALTKTVILKNCIHLMGHPAGTTIKWRTGRVARDALVRLDAKGPCPVGQEPEVSGIRFEGLMVDNPEITANADTGLRVLGRVENIRIHDCTFQGFGRSAISFDGYYSVNPGQSTGVVYNNSFQHIRQRRNHSVYISLGYGVSIIGDKRNWRADLDLGTGNALFVEDNDFSLVRHAVTQNGNARYVFRYNRVNSWFGNFGAVDSHGMSQQPWGGRQWEIYKNTFAHPYNHYSGGRPLVTPEPQNHGIVASLRGGDGVFWGNDIALGGGWNGAIIKLAVEGDQDGDDCDSGPLADQPVDVKLWGNRWKNDGVGWLPVRPRQIGTIEGADEENCFVEGEQYYFLDAAPEGYRPYPYPHPLRHMVVHLKMDGSGKDSSGNGRDATLIGSPRFTRGQVGQALNLDGRDQCAQIDDVTDLRLDGDLTIASWIYIDGLSSWMSVASKDYQAEFDFTYTGNKKMAFFHGNGASWRSVSSLPQLEGGHWEHVAVTRRMGVNSSVIRFYFNGTPDGVPRIHRTFPVTMSGSPVSIGCRRNGGWPLFGGMIDDFRIYDRVLSDAEISVLSRRGRSDE